MPATIFAMATGAGRAAVAIVRLSGPDAGSALRALAGPLPSPRRASLRALRDPASRTVLDHALVLWFPGPESFTGEDGAELHLHGGRAVVAAVVDALGRQPGCRLAAPGEFTRRAYLNGRMDLSAVEGLADLVDAETEAQRRQALRLQDGALERWVAVQRDHLVSALAAAESAIDFSDEADVAADFAAEVADHVASLAAAVARERERSARGAHIRDGFVVALAGPPNAGKSTLLNALARREVAIVSPRPGTTRDAIEVRLDLGGYLVLVVDTAGLRDTDDALEREGIERALARARSADLVLWLSDAAEPVPPDPALEAARVWPVATKADLAPPLPDQPGRFRIAAPSGDGLPRLVSAITGLIAGEASDDGGVAVRARHRAVLDEAARELAAMGDAGPALGLELAAEHLRRVAACLDGLVGRIDAEEVLGAIFARFCVGK